MVQSVVYCHVSQEVVHCRANIKYSTKKLWYIAAMVSD